MEHIGKLARQIGFSQVGKLNKESLIFREEVRKMCASDQCKNYGKSWSCPPACGSLEYFRRKLENCSGGLLVQTTGQMADAFDMTVISQTMQHHKKAFDTLVRQAKKLEPSCIPLGAGACTRCHKCTYPERPCRYPDKRYPSMEATGLWVSDVCEKSGMAYNYGPNTITYTSCILYQRGE